MWIKRRPLREAAGNLETRLCKESCEAEGERAVWVSHRNEYVAEPPLCDGTYRSESSWYGEALWWK